jgi:hypothetical protein
MAGTGTPPKEHRSRERDEKRRSRGDWFQLDAASWQHGAVPTPPAGLLKVSADAWDVWFGAWFAAHWSPSDLPGLRHLIRLYDAVQRGDFTRASEVRLCMDTYGITPKGQQDRRWRPPAPADDSSNGSRPVRRRRPDPRLQPIR